MREKDPLTCHRTIVVTRYMRSDELEVNHILADGRLETNDEAESRLLALMNLPPGDLFTGRSELIERAYELQAEKIAYVASGTSSVTSESL